MYLTAKSRNWMKTHGTFALSMGCGLLLAATSLAGPITDKNNIQTEEAVPLDVVKLDESFVFSSPIQFASKDVGRGDELHSEFDYLRRFQIQGHWYLQAGVTYERFDFGGHNSSPTGPLPSTLQTINMPIGLAYLADDHIGFLAQIRPGVNFEHDINRGSFDIPFELGGYIPLKAEKLYLVLGLGTSILREYPVIPNIGLVWLINDKLRLMGYAPEPKLIYTVDDHLSVWLGGEVLYGSFKIDSNPSPVQGHSISATVVDYTEFRAGLGLAYTPVKNCTLNVAGGYSVQRDFNFYRANKDYTADPAPYVRLQFESKF